MALTIGDVLTEVRYMISDSVATYRNSDSKLRKYGDYGQQAILTEHPTAAYKDDDTDIATDGPDELTAFSDNADSLAIRDSWGMRLAHYIAYRVFSEDAEDIANQSLADKHWEATGLRRRP
jgi:hypothetical protein